MSAAKKSKNKISFFDAAFGTLEFLALIFWMFSELLEKHNQYNLQGVFLWLAMSCFLAGAAHIIQKVFKRTLIVWFTYFGLCLLLAFAVYEYTRPSLANSVVQVNEAKRDPAPVKTNKNFTFTFHYTDSPDDILLLTNDFLIVTNFGNLGVNLGCLVVPAHLGQSYFPIRFGIQSSSFAESIQITVNLQKNWGINPDPEWKLRLVQGKIVSVASNVVEGVNVENELLGWTYFIPEPVYPGDGAMLPIFQITNTLLFLPKDIIQPTGIVGSVVAEGSVYIFAKAKDRPIEGVCFSLSFFPILPDQTNPKPFVAQFHKESGHMRSLSFPTNF